MGDEHVSSIEVFIELIIFLFFYSFLIIIFITEVIINEIFWNSLFIICKIELTFSSINLSFLSWGGGPDLMLYILFFDRLIICKVKFDIFLLSCLFFQPLFFIVFKSLIDFLLLLNSSLEDLCWWKLCDCTRNCWFFLVSKFIVFEFFHW